MATFYEPANFYEFIDQFANLFFKAPKPAVFDLFLQKPIVFSKLANIIRRTKFEGETTMQINGSDLKSQLSVYKTTQSQGNNIEKDKNVSSDNSGALQDRVAFSDQGRLVLEAQRAILFIPDVRETLVSDVQNDLENGTYVFDNQRSAEGILRESMVNEAALYC